MRLVGVILLLPVWLALSAQTWTLEGTGPLPTLKSIAPAPPVVTPPVVPPVTPPVVVPRLPPAVDNSPFIWPPQPRIPETPAQRYAGLGGGFYVGEESFPNPGAGSLLYAGRVANPTAKVGSWFIFGYRVWAPTGSEPWLIRCVMQQGRLCP